MISGSAGELAKVISHALISKSKQTVPTQTWTPLMEQALHRLGCRESLSPTQVAHVIDPHLLHHHSLALGFFDWSSQQPGFSHDSSSYQSILKALSLSRKFNAVDRVLKQSKSQKVNLPPYVYRAVIASQITSKNTRTAFSTFKEVGLLISDIGPQTCNSLLAATSSEGDLFRARNVFDEMTLKGVRLNTLGFGVFVWKFCRCNGLEMTLNLLDEVRRIGFSGINGSVIAVLVAHGLCSGSFVSEAVVALDELRKRDCKPDFMAYRIVAEALREMGNAVDVEWVLKRKRKLGVAPRSNDYKDFILTLISERLISEAKELGEVIMKGDFPMDNDLLNALVGSVSALDPCCSMLFFDFMLDREVIPTLLTLKNLGRNLCKLGKVEMLVEVSQKLFARAYFTDKRSYSLMLTLLCEAGKVKEAYEILGEMKRKGLGLDISSYNSLLEACCREDLLRPAKRLWDEMFTNGCPANLKSYNILIQKCSEVGEVEEAYRLFEHMSEKRVAPDATTYKSLLKGICQAKDIALALHVFDMSVAQSTALSRNILGSFVLYLCREGNVLHALKLLHSHIDDIAFLDSHLTVLRFLSDAGETSLALEHLKLIQDKSAFMFQALHNEILSLSKPDPLMKLFKAMRENSLGSRDGS
ncbi:PREDICTED: pentatricopeptide repeat-containing protein At5g14080 [Ipomoea nil]|uniref:pentatricopeptide repeat-containing protein At5g14080 n=1 Tax=Ipomoea nil TaxID=35883 RepID=UPI000900C17F|nr:PREDICTED: pentatricopeptide repeat-containing protein At5g14080 [Ipomoea nil]XP_019154934.1 PREDICTED: pentatricopeptide repeat-containing protein At5g14080 [Ipomoea nil]XP_019154935.1 PREDICTED: pentatricopeptide repeat-containing protein At5g14080 [Ipomoea nil]XP_019154936.1 PREDICTED: pentatricopeptide repeat-containing protein At5g14080 [Ipomoea nil]XP_019154938.1 PREDICTED: pentatricopeptide repeat-containing protein At5g14080 [Ipomoea nil]XP_019154939.1 PREDICTED: pentatricopeptide r